MSNLRLLIVFIFYLNVNSLFSQSYNEEYLYYNHDNLVFSFIEKYGNFWITSEKGLIRHQNDSAYYYKLSDTSFGDINKYMNNPGDSVYINNYLRILEAESNLVLLNHNKNGNILILKNDCIVNCVPKTDTSFNICFFEYPSYDNRNNLFLHYKKLLTFSAIDKIYILKDDTLSLYTEYESMSHSQFFQWNNQDFEAEVERIDKEFYFSIYLLNDKGKQLYFRSNDSNSLFYSSFEVRVYKNKLYILNYAGYLLTIDSERNYTYNKIDNINNTILVFAFYDDKLIYVNPHEQCLGVYNLMTQTKDDVLIDFKNKDCSFYVSDIFIENLDNIYCIFHSLDEGNKCKNSFIKKYYR